MRGLSNPENITKSHLILSANRALLGEVRPNMRRIFVEYVKEEIKIILYFYYDIPPSQDELNYDGFGVISAEMSCDFPTEINWEEKIIVLPYPNRIPNNTGICVYSRHELDIE